MDNGASDLKFMRTMQRFEFIDNVHLDPVVGGWRVGVYLVDQHGEGLVYLDTARGEPKVFATADSAIRFVRHKIGYQEQIEVQG